MSWEGFIILILLGLSSSVLGVFLVLMRLGFLSAGIAHSALGAVALSIMLGIDTFYITALYSVILGNLILFVSRSGRFSGDLITALFFTSGVAIGIVLLGVSEDGGEHLSEVVLGEPFTAGVGEIILGITLLIAVILFALTTYRSMILILLSRELAKAYGVKTDFLSHLLVSLSSLITVLAMKMVGILLASSLFIIPATASLLIASGLRNSLLLSSVLSLLSVVMGAGLHMSFGLDAGGATVLIMLTLFALLFLFKLVRGRYQ